MEVVNDRDVVGGAGGECVGDCDNVALIDSTKSMILGERFGWCDVKVSWMILPFWFLIEQCLSWCLALKSPARMVGVVPRRVCISRPDSLF